MPKETENYSFKKPLYSENADIAVLNENFDEIDKAFTPTLNSDTEPGTQSKGKLEIVLGWIANRIKAITGKSMWQESPSVTLEDCAKHIDNGTHHNATTTSNGFMSLGDKVKLNNATSDNVASRLMMRDSAGRAKVQNPSDSYDIVNKGGIKEQLNEVYVNVNGTLKSATDILINANGELKQIQPVLSTHHISDTDYTVLVPFQPQQDGVYKIKRKKISGDHELRIYNSDFSMLYEKYLYDMSFELTAGTLYYISITHYYGEDVESESYLQIYREE